MNTDILDEILSERINQDTEWGEQNHLPVVWLAILAEEFGEVAHEIADHLTEPPSRSDIRKLRAELIQTAAVCVAFVESLDRNKLK